METKRKLIHISHKIRALTKFSPRIHHLIFCLIYKKRKTKVFLSLSNLFEITYFLSVFSILKFKQFLKKQCGESEKSPCRAKLCRLESKAGFSQSFELAHYSAVESNFLKSFFFPNIIYHFFSLWPFFSTHSSRFVWKNWWWSTFSSFRH